jgi:hypothetical protein
MVLLMRGAKVLGTDVRSSPAAAHIALALAYYLIPLVLDRLAPSTGEPCVNAY